MPRREAQLLVAKNAGKICIRYARLSNGKTLTADTNLYKITRRAGLAAGVFGATLTLSAIANAQTETASTTTEAPKIEAKQDKDYSKTSRIFLRPTFRFSLPACICHIQNNSC